MIMYSITRAFAIDPARVDEAQRLQTAINRLQRLHERRYRIQVRWIFASGSAAILAFLAVTTVGRARPELLTPAAYWILTIAAGSACVAVIVAAFLADWQRKSAASALRRPLWDFAEQHGVPTWRQRFDEYAVPARLTDEQEWEATVLLNRASQLRDDAKKLKKSTPAGKYLTPNQEQQRTVDLAEANKMLADAEELRRQVAFVLEGTRP